MRIHKIFPLLRLSLILSLFVAAGAVKAAEKPRGPEVKNKHHLGHEQHRREQRHEGRNERRGEHRRGHQREHGRERGHEHRNERRHNNHGGGLVRLHNEVLRHHQEGLHILGELLVPPHSSSHHREQRHHRRHAQHHQGHGVMHQRHHRRARRGHYYEDDWGDCYWVQRRHGRKTYSSVPRSYCW